MWVALWGHHSFGEYTEEFILPSYLSLRKRFHISFAVLGINNQKLKAVLPLIKASKFSLVFCRLFFLPEAHYQFSIDYRPSSNPILATQFGLSFVSLPTIFRILNIFPSNNQTYRNTPRTREIQTLLKHLSLYGWHTYCSICPEYESHLYTSIHPFYSHTHTQAHTPIYLHKLIQLIQMQIQRKKESGYLLRVAGHLTSNPKKKKKLFFPN